MKPARNSDAHRAKMARKAKRRADDYARLSNPARIASLRNRGNALAHLAHRSEREAARRVRQMTRQAVMK